MRIHELAKELGVQSKDILASLEEMGFEGRTASSTVPDEAIPRLRAAGGRVKPGSKPVAATVQQLPTRRRSVKAKEKEAPSGNGQVVAEAPTAAETPAEAPAAEPPAAAAVPVAPVTPLAPVAPFVPLAPVAPFAPVGPLWFQLSAFSPAEHLPPPTVGLLPITRRAPLLAW